MPNTAVRRLIPYGTGVIIRQTKQRATVLGLVNSGANAGKYMLRVHAGGFRYCFASELNTRPGTRGILANGLEAICKPSP